MVEKYAPEAQDITASVRDLPTVRTHMGRARAWLRVALMQKKLADYLKVLIDNRDEILAEYFEPDALMLSDEAIIIIGLLVGLNVIDCNLCVKVISHCYSILLFEASYELRFVGGRLRLSTGSNRLFIIFTFVESNNGNF